MPPLPTLGLATGGMGGHRKVQRRHAADGGRFLKSGFWLLAAMLTVLVLLAACSEEEETVTATATPAPAPTPAPTPTGPTPTCPGGALDATWGCIQNLVFTPICSGCHGGNAGLFLDAQNSPSIVGRASTEQPSLQLIKVGDPDNSYLIRKIEGGPAITGSRMPLTGCCLPSATIQFIRAWVTAGANVP